MSVTSFRRIACDQGPMPLRCCVRHHQRMGRSAVRQTLCAVPDARRRVAAADHSRDGLFNTMT